MLLKQAKGPGIPRRMAGNSSTGRLKPLPQALQAQELIIDISGVDVHQLVKCDVNDVKTDTMRVSGPIGQNVNKVETAVRGVHVLRDPARLEAKVLAWQTERLVERQHAHGQRIAR
ncbi:hypothetical protein GS398_14720 [Pedobacter sp. HMF7056]|uniref:Aminoacyl-tRNA hydrolase n=1 Tax=Hufsiella ginkgonis TaxID=2695274 RepID=A0A7K1Y1J8_9SPHI|nr:hypothetical protein [Hufsiella ginkgonis]